MATIKDLKLSEKFNWADSVDENENVNKLSENEDVVIVDTLETMNCFHFTDINNHASDDIKQYRGIIKNQNGDILCKSFGFTPEISESDENSISLFLEPLLKNNPLCFPAYEGTVVRLFQNPETSHWHLSTHKKINSFKSRWGFGKSYGDLFANYLRNYQEFNLLESNEDIIQAFGNCLVPNYIHTFLISSYKENRIICNKHLEQPYVYFIGSFAKDSNFLFSLGCEGLHLKNECYDKKDELNGLFQQMISFGNFSTMDQVREQMKLMNSTLTQGLLFIDTLSEEVKSVKLLLKEYEVLLQLRKNNPNIILRYIEIQQEGVKENVEKFLELYNDQKDIFIEFEKVIDDISGNIFRKYRNRFVRKLVSIAPPEQYYVIRELHELYLQNKEQNIITPEKVASYVYNLSPDRLFGLYNMYMKRKELTGHGNKIKEDFREKVKDLIYK
jgi:hypothetical protein